MAGETTTSTKEALLRLVHRQNLELDRLASLGLYGAEASRSWESEQQQTPEEQHHLEEEEEEEGEEVPYEVLASELAATVDALREERRGRKSDEARFRRRWRDFEERFRLGVAEAEERAAAQLSASDERQAALLERLSRALQESEDLRRRLGDLETDRDKAASTDDRPDAAKRDRRPRKRRPARRPTTQDNNTAGDSNKTKATRHHTKRPDGIYTQKGYASLRPRHNNALMPLPDDF